MLATAPAVLVVGPRAVGKTTTASRHVRTVVRLDRDAEAAAFRADPDVALAAVDHPVLLDEWQEVPGVLGAVKRAIDRDWEPGRYLLTGSVTSDIEAETWPGTGRLIRASMWGLTGRERFGDPTRPSLIDRLIDVGADALRTRTSLHLGDYVGLAMTGGFPRPVLELGDQDRARWLDSYVAATVTRDARLVESGRDPDRLRRFFQAYASCTATVVDDLTLIQAAGVDRRTARAYEQLLTNLLVVSALPAWTANPLRRMVLRAKRHLADAALVGPLLVADERSVLRDGDLLGKVLETYVVGHLRAEVAVAEERARLGHLRTKEGRQEIDAVVETPRGILAFEVRADAAPRAGAAAHLRWLQGQLGERFLLGVVLHTGPQTFELGPSLVAAPIAALFH